MYTLVHEADYVTFFSSLSVKFLGSKSISVEKERENVSNSLPLKTDLVDVQSSLT